MQGSLVLMFFNMLVLDYIDILDFSFISVRYFRWVGANGNLSAIDINFAVRFIIKQETEQ